MIIHPINQNSKNLDKKHNKKESDYTYKQRSSVGTLLNEAVLSSSVSVFAKGIDRLI